MNKALITGINGQDGSYLAELLLEKGYVVTGIIRRSSYSSGQTQRINHLMDRIKLEYGDMTDVSNLTHIIQNTKPTEIYNLAAQSHVRVSFDLPIFTAQTVAIGQLNLLEAVRVAKSDARIYQASSSEMFGNTIDSDGFQRETTSMNPVSPYGCAKVFAYNISRNYRNSYDLFISNGILFNHESPRRGESFVTNKIAKSAVEILRGKKDRLYLGNLGASRDWGHSKDYVEAMWRILQLDKPTDLCCSSGISHTVNDVVQHCFDRLELNSERYVCIDPKYMRPEELHNLKGDSSKLRKLTGWKPIYTFESMLDEMVDYWLKEIT